MPSRGLLLLSMWLSPGTAWRVPQVAVERSVLCASARHVRCTPLQLPQLHSSCRQRSSLLKLAAGSSEAASQPEEELPRAVLPICLGVFVQMLGEGIAVSSLPLHMTTLGATPLQVGFATSAFSVAQMVCCPALVRLSTRLGSAAVLRICLVGAAISNLGSELDSPCTCADPGWHARRGTRARAREAAPSRLHPAAPQSRSPPRRLASLRLGFSRACSPPQFRSPRRLWPTWCLRTSPPEPWPVCRPRHSWASSSGPPPPPCFSPPLRRWRCRRRTTSGPSSPPLHACAGVAHTHRGPSRRHARAPLATGPRSPLGGKGARGQQPAPPVAVCPRSRPGLVSALCSFPCRRRLGRLVHRRVLRAGG